MWPAAAAIVAHFVLRLLLDDWLNSQSDLRLAVALILVAAPVVFAAVVLYRSLFS